MGLRNNFECPWCSHSEKAFTGDGGERELKEHAKKEHKGLWKFYQNAIEKWEQDMADKIEEEDSISTTLKLKMMKHFGKGSPSPHEIQKVYRRVKD